MDRKTWFRFLIIILLTAIFLYFFFRRVDWKKVLLYLTDVNPFFFALIVILVPVHLLTRAFRWKYLLIHEKKDIKFFNLFAGNAVGFTITLIFPGRLGELIKPLYLAQKEKIRKGYAIGTVVVERTFDMFTMCFLLGVFLLARPLYSSSFQVNDSASSILRLWGLVGLAFAFFLLAVILSLYFFREKALSVVRLLVSPFPPKVSEKILNLFHEFVQGLKFFHSVGNLITYTALSFVVWLGISFYYWMFFFAYHVSLSYFLVIPYVFLVLVGASIPTPGMVGGFHYFSKLGLTSLYTIDVNLAFGMTLVVHAVQVVVTCLLGYAILWKEGMSLFQVRKLSTGEVE